MGFDLGAVRRSVKVWQGEHDTLLPMSNARRLAAALPGGTLRVVSAMGHYLPAVVADAVLENSRHDPSTPRESGRRCRKGPQ